MKPRTRKHTIAGQIEVDVLEKGSEDELKCAELVEKITDILDDTKLSLIMPALANVIAIIGMSTEQTKEEVIGYVGLTVTAMYEAHVAPKDQPLQ